MNLGYSLPVAVVAVHCWEEGWEQEQNNPLDTQCHFHNLIHTEHTALGNKQGRIDTHRRGNLY